MAKNTKGLEISYEVRKEESIRKVNEAIEELLKEQEVINFSSVNKKSGVTRAFMYNNKEIRHKIESLRNLQINKNINQRAKFDKTSKSKDVIITTKDKKIEKLEKENKLLKEQINILQAKIYKES